MKKMVGLISLVFFMCISSFAQDPYINNQFSALQDASAWINRLRAGYMLTDSIINPSSSTNSRLLLGNNGTVIDRLKISDGFPVLTVDQRENTSNARLQSWRRAGVEQAYMSWDGTLCAPRFQSPANNSAAFINLSDVAGFSAGRNLADNIPANTFANLNGLSTGLIAEFKNAEGSPFVIDRYGLTTIKPTRAATSINTTANALDIFPNYRRVGATTTILGISTLSDATPGTYTNIATTNVSGTGTGLTINVTVAPGSFTATYTVNTGGSGYNPGDNFTILKSAVGGPSGTYGTTVGNVNSTGTYLSQAPLNVRSYLQQGGTINDFNVLQRWSLVDRATGNNFGGGYAVEFGYYYPNTASAYPAFRSGSTIALAFEPTGGAVRIPTLAGTTVNYATINGNTFIGGLYTSVNGGYSTSGSTNGGVTFNAVQTKLLGSSSFRSAQTSTVGSISSLTITNGGAGYTNGTYNGLTATGGTGINLTINVTVAGGVVTAVTTGNNGSGYTAANTVTATIPGGSGFSATVNLRAQPFRAFDNADVFNSSSADTYYGYSGLPRINQTTGATGDVYGFYWNPTITSLLGNHNAIHTVTGNVLLATTSGNVGIGTTNPGSYKLAVEGTIGARRVKVTQATWADYVFDSSYQLASLHQVEKYIQTNKHLPDVPSAAEVKKGGLDLGDNQAVLLKKIEELTLYIIEQNKRMESLEHQVKVLQDKK
jgi:hypothetical protein